MLSFYDSILTRATNVPYFRPKRASLANRDWFVGNRLPSGKRSPLMAVVVTNEPRGFQVYQTNKQKNLRQTLLLGAASVAALGIAAPAMAQDSGSVETVVVTGSRIPQTGLYSSSPVTAVGQQEAKFQGTTSVETLLNSLPSVFADFGQTSSNGATGQATVDLRGLGAQRTLVLVDGKRLMPGDPTNPVADLNNIPAALVDHVEVLTGGASAVYGSDALAGVVNFIMRKDFEGIELDGQYTVNQASNDNPHDAMLQHNAGFPTAEQNWWGGESNDFTLLMGSNTADNKGNVTAYFGYRNTQPVLESKRDFSACSITTPVSRSGVVADHHVCSGSSNFARTLSFDQIFANNGNPYDFFTGATPWVPYTGVPSQKFNYGPLNYLQRPDTRYSAGFFGHYEVNKMLDVYTSFMMADDHTLAQIAPSGAFIGSGPLDFPGTLSPGYFQINCANPLMTAAQRTQLCGGQDPAHNPQQVFFGNPCTPVGNTGNCNLVPEPVDRSDRPS